MSTTSPPTTSDASTGYGLTSLGGSSTLQVTGLSSGLDTDKIVSELMQVKEQPLTALQSQEGQLQARDTELSALQSELQTVADDAQSLLDPSLYDPTQSVSSSNSTAVSASATSSNGAVEGGYQVDVTTLAKSAQRTFTYAPPSSSESVTIDGQAVTINAGESAASFAAAVNGNANLDVYATATDAGTIVLSNRATGDTGGSFLSLPIVDSGNALTEQTAKAKEGVDAAYTVDGVAGTSHSNTVTGAIPGVTLTLNALTTTSGPVTVDVGAPAVDASSVQSALTKFITDYNTAIGDIQTQLSTPPSSSTDPTTGATTYKGTLYGDQDLSGLLAQMRSMMYQTVPGTNSGLTTPLNVGVSTGATTGTGSLSTSSLSGNLTLDASSLAGALSSDPDGVQKLLGGWAESFSSLVEDNAGTGGTIDTRISANKIQINDLSNQISRMQTSLDDQQKQLVAQFAAMEAALSSTQSESAWLTQQINSMSSS